MFIFLSLLQLRQLVLCLTQIALKTFQLIDLCGKFCLFVAALFELALDAGEFFLLVLQRLRKLNIGLSKPGLAVFKFVDPVGQFSLFIATLFKQ